MSLKEAVLEIADEMVKTAEEEGGDVQTALKLYAKQIRLVCKAVGDSPSPMQSAQDQHASAIAAARAEFRGKVKKIDDEGDNRMVEVIGSTGQPSLFVPIPSNMPVGASTQIGKDVYQLRADGKLHFVGNDT